MLYDHLLAADGSICRSKLMKYAHGRALYERRLGERIGYPASWAEARQYGLKQAWAYARAARNAARMLGPERRPHVVVRP